MARPTVRILNRYLLRQHVAPLAFALAALTFFLLIQQVAKQLGNLVGKGLPWGVIIQVFALSIPFIVATTLPMAVLVAVLYAFTRLATDNEITAMKAGGVSIWQLLHPVLSGALAVALVAFVWNDQVLPRSNHELRMLLMDIQRKKPSFSLKEQVINEVVAGQFFLRAARIDPASNKLKDVTIYDLGDAERRRFISADSGQMAYTPGGQDLYLTLRDGDIREVKRSDPSQFNRTFFQTNRIRVAGVGNTLERTENDSYRSDREMGSCEMLGIVRDTRRDVADAMQEGRRAVQSDLRHLAGLGALPVPPTVKAPADSTPVGVYCRVLAWVAGWLKPATAAAQTPGRRAARPAHPARPPLPPPPARVPLVQNPVPGQRPPAVLSPVLSDAAVSAARVRTDIALDREARLTVEIHKKFALAAACVVFALLGVPVAIHFPRGGIGLVIGVSLVVFTIYYIGLIGGEELGDHRVVSPVLAMWAANGLFTLLALIGFVLARRPAHSISGANWADIGSVLLGPLARRRR
ncbi:MAG TPA: LptF/LptG family permease [Gemmatimonadales bacterium]|nr:LptF/LptG family permease [Gemmatimonadales bacterium]